MGRAHLAMLLQQKGWVPNFKAAFEKYIGPGCPGYAPKYKQTPFEAIELIRSSGGVAVMAHPMLTQKDELIPRFAAAGLKGLEVYYPNSMNTVTQFYERIAQKNGLIATGGSDAHGKAKSYTYVGKKTVPDGRGRTTSARQQTHLKPYEQRFYLYEPRLGTGLARLGQDIA